MSNVPDPFEFVKNLWGQMGIPGFGQGAAVAGGLPGGMPAFSAEELEKRLGELKQIRQWLEINLNMLSLQVNGLEMQLNAIKSMKAAPGAEFMQQAAEAMRSAAAAQTGFAQSPAPANPVQAGFAPPGFGQFPFGAATPAQAAAPAAAEAAKPLNWPDPTGWMQTLQSEFAKGMASIAPAAPAPAKPAARKGSTPARKAVAKKARGKT